MLTEEQILEIIELWRKKTRLPLKKRLIVKEIKASINKEVIDLVGVRRSGKSSALFLLIQELKLKDDDYLYINFEEPLFIGNYSVSLLENIWQVFKQNYNPSGKPYIFLDEIQYIEGWEQWVRKIRDLELAHVFVTGSSAKLLSKEFGTKLTGRHKTFQVFPLSFKSFLAFKGVKEQDISSKKLMVKNKQTILKHFKEFLVKGGFPEITITKNQDLLKEYFDDILYKDIVSRYEIRDVKSLKRLAVFCLTNITKKFSYNTIKKLYGQSLESTKAYLSFLEEAFLIFQAPFFSYSLKTQENHQRKIFAIDNGLRNAVSFRFSKDKGKLAENLVFVELKRKNKEIFYWAGKNEVDFVVKNKDNKLIAINVTYSQEIDKRELKGLFEFKENYKQKVKETILLTKNIEKTEKGVKFIPLWKWLLKGNLY